MRIIAPVAALAALAFTGLGAQAAERIVTMPFQDCLAIVAEAAEETEAKPVELVATADLRTVRLAADDGFVTISCSRAGNRMTVSTATLPGRMAAR